MKKKISLVLAVLLVVGLVFMTSCGSDSGNEIRLIMATGGVAGTYYPFGGAMAGVINNNSDNINITSVASGASADNLRQIQAGDAHIAIAQNDVMSYAFNANFIWEGQDAVTNFGTIMTLYPETVQIVVRADSGIYEVEDIRGHRVSVGDVGSGVEANTWQVLRAHGITEADITVHNIGFAASADAMRDGMLDVFFLTTAAPNTAVAELSVAHDLRLVPIRPEMAAQLMATYPFYVQLYLTDEYTFLTEPIHTIAVQATLLAALDVPEDVVYDIARILIDYQAEVAEGHFRGNDISLENAVQSISVDFHPGARRFFTERGMLP